MIEYHIFNGSHLQQLQEQKLGELEAEHARITMELKLAGLSGIENSSVDQARSQLAIVEVQHTAVASWLDLEADTVPEAANEDGDGE